MHLLRPALRAAVVWPTIRSVSRRMAAIRVDDAEQRTYRIQLEFVDGARKLSLDTVFQDTLPAGSRLGTVIAIHGSPGSHKDFKYVTPHLERAGLRVIGVNYPGYGVTEDTEEVQHTNEERAAFVEALIDRLGLTQRLIVLGHSRGGENALDLATRNTDKCLGVALVCPFGLRINRGMRPRSRIDNIRYLYDNYRWLRGPIEWYLYEMYNRVVGLRVRHGRHAMCAIKSLTNVAFEKQQTAIDRANRTPDLVVLLCYAGKDHLIETDISEEYAAAIGGFHHLTCSKEDDEGAVSAEMEQVLATGSGRPRRVSVAFPDDNHFAQKKRAELIARGIVAIANAAPTTPRSSL